MSILENFDAEKEIANYLVKKLEEKVINENQFNLMSSLVALNENDTYITYLQFSRLDGHVSGIKRKLINNKEATEHEQWLNSLSVGDPVEIRVGETKRKNGYLEFGVITKIFKGKKGTTYTVKLTHPYVYYRRNHGEGMKNRWSEWHPQSKKEKSIFKVKEHELNKP